MQDQRVWLLDQGTVVSIVLSFRQWAVLCLSSRLTVFYSSARKTSSLQSCLCYTKDEVGDIYRYLSVLKAHSYLRY